MKKLSLVLVLVVALALVGVSVVSALGPNCTTQPQSNGTKLTTCVVDTLKDPAVQVGGYSLAQISGMTIVPQANGELVVTVANQELVAKALAKYYPVVRAGGDVVYFPKNSCKTSYNGKQTSTNCTYVGTPVLVGDGPFTFAQVTGLQFAQNDTGGVDSLVIASGLGTTGSMNRDGSVTGFYSVAGSDSSVLLYRISK